MIMSNLPKFTQIKNSHKKVMPIIQTNMFQSFEV